MITPSRNMLLPSRYLVCIETSVQVGIVPRDNRASVELIDSSTEMPSHSRSKMSLKEMWNMIKHRIICG